MECLDCNTRLEDDSLFCDACGQEILVCEACGKPGKGKRCIDDGKVLRPRKELAAGASRSGPVEPPEAKPTTAEPASTPGSSLAALPPVAPLPRLYLVNETIGARIEIDRPVLLGRTMGEHSSLLGQYAAVSSQHARIYYEKGWWFCDVGSSNGSWCGLQKLIPNQPVQLLDGLRIRLANLEFIVQIPEALTGAGGTMRL